MLSKYIFCSNLYKGRSNHSALSEIAKNSENTGKKRFVCTSLHSCTEMISLQSVCKHSDNIYTVHCMYSPWLFVVYSINMLNQF